jgi:hypothetical protein
VIQEEDDSSPVKTGSNPFYHQFAAFINSKEIERDEFCTSAHMYLDQGELLQNFRNINYDITPEEVLQIFKDFGAHKAGYLEMDGFFLKLPCWRDFNANKFG